MSDTTNNNQLDILVVGAPVDRIIFRNNTAKDPERDMEILANIVLEAWLEAVDIVENSPLLESADSSNVSCAIPSEEEAFADFSDIVSDALAHKPAITKRKASREGNYTVQPGDTLYTLARQFNTTVDRLAMMNNIDDDNRGNIYVGERLWVPVGTPTASERPLFGNIEVPSFVSLAARDDTNVVVRDRYLPYARVNMPDILMSQLIELRRAILTRLKKKNDADLWMSIAQGELGVTEMTGNNDGKDVEKYLKTVGLGPGANSFWCGAFANWVMLEAGISANDIRPAWALDWRKFGVELSSPAYGAIATKSRRGGGHVGFVAGKTVDGKIVLLGGNQDDMVNYQAFPASELKYNFPARYTPNYNLEIMENIKINKNMQ